MLLSTYYFPTKHQELMLIGTQLTVTETRNWRELYPTVKETVQLSTLLLFPKLTSVIFGYLSDRELQRFLFSTLSHFPLLQRLFSYIRFHLVKHKASSFIQTLLSLIQHNSCGEPQTTQHTTEIKIKPLNFVRKIINYRAEAISH